jgi:hypothetical protein
MNGSKPWYLSKTLWAAVIATIAAFAQAKWGFVISPAAQIAIGSGIFAILRLVTKTSVRFTKNELPRTMPQGQGYEGEPTPTGPSLNEKG